LRTHRFRKRPFHPYLSGMLGWGRGVCSSKGDKVWGGPASDLDEYLDWQERLESYQASGLSVDEFCLSEGIGEVDVLSLAGSA